MGLGESYLALGEPKRAIEPLERGIAIEAALEPGSFDLARMRLALARASWDSGGDRVRAKSIALQARDRFFKGPGRVKDLAQADTWLATHGAR